MCGVKASRIAVWCISKYGDFGWRFLVEYKENWDRCGLGFRIVWPTVSQPEQRRGVGETPRLEWPRLPFIWVYLVLRRFQRPWYLRSPGLPVASVSFGADFSCLLISGNKKRDEKYCKWKVHFHSSHLFMPRSCNETMFLRAGDDAFSLPTPRPEVACHFSC